MGRVWDAPDPLRGRGWSAGDLVSRPPLWLSGSRRPADACSVDRGGAGRETEPLTDGVVLPHGVRAHVARRVVQGRGSGLRQPFGPDGGEPGRGWHDAVTSSRVGRWQGTTECPTDRQCRSAGLRLSSRRQAPPGFPALCCGSAQPSHRLLELVSWSCTERGSVSLRGPEPRPVSLRRQSLPTSGKGSLTVRREAASPATRGAGRPARPRAARTAGRAGGPATQSAGPPARAGR